MKEAQEQHVNTLVPSLQSLGLSIVVTIEKDGTKVHIGNEVSLVLIPPKHGEIQKEDVRTDELDLNTNPEEQNSIQTLVTLLVSKCPLSSKTIQ